MNFDAEKIKYIVKFFESNNMKEQYYYIVDNSDDLLTLINSIQELYEITHIIGLAKIIDILSETIDSETESKTILLFLKNQLFKNNKNNHFSSKNNFLNPPIFIENTLF